MAQSLRVWKRTERGRKKLFSYVQNLTKACKCKNWDSQETKCIQDWSSRVCIDRNEDQILATAWLNVYVCCWFREQANE